MNGNGNARGLEVSVHCPNVRVIVNNVTIGNNSGGNLQLNVTDFNDGFQNNIKISNSCIYGGRGSLGSGMEFLSRTPNLKSENSSCARNSGHHSVLVIYNTTFTANYAGSNNSAISVRFHHERCNCISKTVVFRFCSFTYSHGIGPTISMGRELISSDSAASSLNVSFEHCEFRCNTASDFLILDIVQTLIAVSDSLFTGNNGTAISLHNSHLNLCGIVVFEHNKAEYGAALKILEQSIIFMYRYSYILFINNTALIGGSVFVQEPDVDINNIPPCVFQPTLPESTPIEEFSKSLRIEFVNNSAKIDGDAIYGGSISTCYTITKYSYHGRLHMSNFPHIFDEIFNMSGQTGPSWVSSRPQGVCFCRKNETVPHKTCLTEHPVINVYPGANFNISAYTVGN